MELTARVNIQRLFLYRVTQELPGTTLEVSAEFTEWNWQDLRL